MLNTETEIIEVLSVLKDTCSAQEWHDIRLKELEASNPVIVEEDVPVVDPCQTG